MKKAMAGELGKTPSPEGSENYIESILSVDSILKTVRNKIFFFKFCLFIHERHTERRAEAQAEVEAGSMQGA